MMKKRMLQWLLPLLMILTLGSCKPTPKHGYIKVRMNYVWNTDTLNFDQQRFITASGEELSIESLRFFIRQISLYGSEGKLMFQGEQSGYFSHLPSERERLFTTDIPIGTYTKIAFTLGFNDAENISNRFSEMPERDMFWPENLGGGYHFMKIDGKWKLPEETQDQGFGLHLGRLIRMQYDTIWNRPDSIERVDSTRLVFPMHMEVSIPQSIDIRTQKITTLDIVMDLSKFWDGPHLYQFALDGAAIMQDEQAMDKVRKNGVYVFR